MATLIASTAQESKTPDSKCMTPYNIDLDFDREKEFPMLQGTTYLDHAGTTLYPKSLIDNFSKDMMSNLLGNPHSASTSSQLSTRRVEDVRLRALQYFNADPDVFDLVFVANATAGIKLVTEGFREQENGFWYGYHKDSHTSLVGAREMAEAGHHCFTSDAEVEAWIDSGDHTTAQSGGDALILFAYPAQSNMNGRRLPLSWTSRLRSSKRRRRIYNLLDAAALISTSPLDLGDVSTVPDYTVLSFYKIFGFPDLGALIVRKDSASILQSRKYFGGGTVEMVACARENWHVQKYGSLHQQLEDGTLPIHSIIALDSALNVYAKLYGSIDLVACRAIYLTKKLYEDLATLRHCNGRKVCEIYIDPASSYSDSRTQGPVIAFNLKDDRGNWISNTEIEKLANVRGIQLRSGGLCNPGGIASWLDLAPWELKRNFSAGHRCGNENDIIGGKPTGMLRVSLGAMSNMQDIMAFLRFVEEFFVDHTRVKQQLGSIPAIDREFYVETLTVYPIKSCGGWSIPSNISWEIRAEGLAWDREWCLVHQGSRSTLSQKKYPKMALLRPSLDLKSGLLRVQYHGLVPSSTPQEICVPLSADPSVFRHAEGQPVSSSATIWGEQTVTQTYAGKGIADFFSNLVGTPCTLARLPTATARLSVRHSKAHLTGRNGNQGSAPASSIMPRPTLLSNESPILTISRSSLNRLNEQIKQHDGKAAHASVFRANIVVAEDLSSSPGMEQPYLEDDWQSIRVGSSAHLDILGPCRRCQMVCVDQNSAERNEEPLVTLAKTRRRHGKVNFGVHNALSDVSKGNAYGIQVGDRITPGY